MPVGNPASEAASKPKADQSSSVQPRAIVATRPYGALIADGRFFPAGFAAPLGQKDIRLVLAAAEDLRVPMPVASLLRDRFLNLLAHGGEELDWSAIGQLPATDAGTATSSTS